MISVEYEYNWANNRADVAKRVSYFSRIFYEALILIIISSNVCNKFSQIAAGAPGHHIYSCRCKRPDRT